MKVKLKLQSNRKGAGILGGNAHWTLLGGHGVTVAVLGPKRALPHQFLKEPQSWGSFFMEGRRPPIACYPNLRHRVHDFPEVVI